MPENSRVIHHAMTIKCAECRLVNFSNAEFCTRCNSRLVEIENITPKRAFNKSSVLKRIGVFIFASVFTLAGFYLTLLLSADSIKCEEKQTVARAVAILDDRGFSDEVWLLRYVTAFRGTDNWLNASIQKENAYAATNFPFEIMTLYPGFFTVPVDDTEHAAILLHEAQHLEGKGEAAAYEFVWKNRKRLGWTSEKYKDSEIWQSVRRQTKEYSPNLFVCTWNQFSDCTEDGQQPPASFK